MEDKTRPRDAADEAPRPDQPPDGRNPAPARKPSDAGDDDRTDKDAVPTEDLNAANDD